MRWIQVSRSDAQISTMLLRRHVNHHSHPITRYAQTGRTICIRVLARDSGIDYAGRA